MKGSLRLTSIPAPFIEGRLRKPRCILVHALGGDASIVCQTRYFAPTLLDAANKSMHIIVSSYVNALGIEPLFRAAEKIERPLHMICFCRNKGDAIAIDQEPAYDLQSNPARSSSHKRNAPVALLAEFSWLRHV